MADVSGNAMQRGFSEPVGYNRSNGFSEPVFPFQGETINGNIRMKIVGRVFVFLGVLGSLAWSWPVRAQPIAPQVTEERNKKLRIQFDRTKIRAFEPVYLCVSAERFATATDPELQLRRDDEPWQPISIPAKAWFKSDIDGPGTLHTQRRGAKDKRTKMS